MRIRHLLACALLLLLPVLALGQLGNSKLPTQEEIQGMIDAKAYRPALRAIAQVMPVAAAGTSRDYDKYTLLMMRGECLIQTQDGYTAGVAYDQASQATTSLAQNETARAMVLLLKKSFALVYTPRTGDRTKLNLADPEERKKAMSALLADELPTIDTQANEALKAKSLPPLMAVIPTLRDLHALEVQATGDDKQTMAIAKALGDRIYELIGSELSRIGAQTNAIQRAAAAVVAWGGGSYQRVGGVQRFVPAAGASGLTSEQRQALRDNVKYCDQIAETCDSLVALARRYEREGQRWQDQAKSARDLRNAAVATYENE